MAEKKWEKRKDESVEAYEAALCYFEMGMNRSLPAVCEKLGKSLSRMKRWSTRHAWIVRAFAFDVAGDALVHRAMVNDMRRQALASARERFGTPCEKVESKIVRWIHTERQRWMNLAWNG